ncbi:MAG: TetR family transcriptional regulator C-terminal domain-containing protein [Ruminiclostridium sp.]|nr:TetR family transcriptional regulator C-terminal domain-containing protein [Ruminiclostridium sp.]
MARALSDAAISVCVPIGYLGNINGKDDIDIDFMYTFIDFGMYNVIKKWLMNDIPKTPEQIAEIMGDMIFRQV